MASQNFADDLPPVLAWPSGTTSSSISSSMARNCPPGAARNAARKNDLDQPLAAEPVPIVFGSFPTHEAFAEGLQALRTADYAEDEVGVLCLADRHADEMQSLQWLSSIGAFSLPGMGSFIAAGPLMSALVKIGDLGAFKAGADGLTAAFIALGMHEDDARALSTQLRQGALLLAAYPDPRSGHDPRHLFTNAGASAVYSSKHIHRNPAAA